MASRISEDSGIHQRHYVRKATAGNHWFDFMASKAADYRSRFGDNFCLIVNGSETIDDAYIIPWTIARGAFTDTAVDARGRWVGTIKGSTMTLGVSGQSLSVAAYHNAFDLLVNGTPRLAEEPIEAEESVRFTSATLAEESIETHQFAFEAHLRDFLAKNLERVESGLQLYQGANHLGIEYPVESGRIDILAVDRQGKFVVIELKLSQGRNRTLGQLLYYMSWVDQNLGSAPCRGVIIASEISDDLRVAISRVPGVSLARYRMSFSVDHLEG
jgi:hypothetical protein